jgi:hypothetical protein
MAGLLLASAVATLALVGLGVGLFFNARLRVALDQTQLARAAEKEQRQRAELLKSLYHVGMVHAGWQNGNLVQAEHLLEQCPPDQRHWEWHYLKRLCHADLFTFTGHDGVVYDAVFSPEGTRIASFGSDRLVKLSGTPAPARSSANSLSTKCQEGVLALQVLASALTGPGLRPVARTGQRNSGTRVLAG